MGAAIVGRASELDAIAHAFDVQGARLVTVVGVGGIGKTTIARAFATKRASASGSANAIVVDLHDARTVAELFDRMTAANASPDALANDDAVLVLDDFDLLAKVAAETVEQWIDRWPSIEIVITSRERLGIAGEHVLEVGPLLRSEDRTQLLVASAQRTAIGYTYASPNDAVIVAEIASLLDGVPLALDIAGARLPLVGATALLQDLRARPQNAQRMSPLGAALDAAVRGSWEALSEPERTVLAQLIVFRGGFSIDAVRAVTNDVAALYQLFERSLVRRVTDAPRFDLYAHVRDFVAGNVAAATRSIIEDATRRHAIYFVAEAERRQARVDREARAWFREERENVVEIARRVVSAKTGTGTVDRDHAELALRAIVAAKDVLLAQGPTAELAELITPLVNRTRDSGADPKLSARVLLLRGAIRRPSGVRSSLPDLIAAESIARAVNDDLLGAEASLEIAKTLRAGAPGELEAAKQTLDRAARAFAKAGARIREAEALSLLGNAMNDAAGRALCERAVALGGDDGLIGGALHLLLAWTIADATPTDPAIVGLLDRIEDHADIRTTGRARLLRGILDGDERMISIARDIFMMNGFAHDAAIARGHLGVVARERGSTGEAYALLADARDHSTTITSSSHTNAPSPASEDKTHAIYFGAHLAVIDLAMGRPAAARDLLAEVDARGPCGESDPWWPMQSGVNEVVVHLRAVVDGGGAPTTAESRSLLARIFARSSSSALTTPSSKNDVPSETALVIGKGGTWFRPPNGSRVGLERRASLALLLDRLAERPGETLRSIDLFAAAWPGEKAIAGAAAHRVRVAIATLRKMGLRDALVTTPNGYGLDPATDLVRA